jgi:hypothetical protein
LHRFGAITLQQISQAMASKKSTPKIEHYLIKHKRKAVFINTIDLDEMQLEISKHPLIMSNANAHRLHTEILEWKRIYDSGDKYYNGNSFEVKLVELNIMQSISTPKNGRYLLKHKTKDLFIYSKGWMDLHVAEHPHIATIADANYIHSNILKWGKIGDLHRKQYFDAADFEIKFVEFVIK